MQVDGIAMVQSEVIPNLTNQNPLFCGVPINSK